MPASYVIDEQRGLVVTTGTGVVTFEECKQHQDRLIADPEFDSTYNQLMDFSQATRVKLDESNVHFLVVRHVFTKPSRRALVSTDAQFIDLMQKAAELRKQFFGDEDVQFFSNREAALRWLSDQKAAVAGSSS